MNYELPFLETKKWVKKSVERKYITPVRKI